MTEPVRRIGAFYAVEPVEDPEQDCFPATLEGLCGKRGALVRAVGRSAGNHTVLVTKTEGGHTRRIREFCDGQETWRSGAALIPPPDAATPPPPVIPVRGLTAIRGSRDLNPQARRQRTAEKTRWPGLSLVPPCADDAS
jgi:hypothetical protein